MKSFVKGDNPYNKKARRKAVFFVFSLKLHFSGTRQYYTTIYSLAQGVIIAILYGVVHRAGGGGTHYFRFGASTRHPLCV